MVTYSPEQAFQQRGCAVYLLDPVTKNLNLIQELKPASHSHLAVLQVDGAIRAARGAAGCLMASLGISPSTIFLHRFPGDNVNVVRIVSDSHSEMLTLALVVCPRTLSLELPSPKDARAMMQLGDIYEEI